MCSESHTSLKRVDEILYLFSIFLLHLYKTSAQEMSTFDFLITANKMQLFLIIYF